jgi:putative Mg2+ transporter-C (MgtC) family protein
MDSLLPFVKILVALIFGMVLGLQRRYAGKIAGMRTFGLVSMGSCLLVVTSEIVNMHFLGRTMFDPMRLAAGIITGVGFLGAGTIFFNENRLSGLTTAAGLWVAAGIGMTVGFGLFSIALFSAVLVFMSFGFFGAVEHKFQQHFSRSKKGDVEDLANLKSE